MKFILGKKIEMTQKFAEDGTVKPVTVVQAGPCVVTQVKNMEKDGYTAVQVGFGEKKSLTQSLLGHLKGLPKSRFIKEFRVDKVDGFEKGKVFDVTSFVAGDIVAVSAISKGKGFQGVVKRHHFGGHPETHGHKDQLRMPGSIGATEPQRVFKGMRMAGHMGDERVTTKNMELFGIDQENNLLFIVGSVPGARNALVEITAPGEIKFKVESEKSKDPDSVKETVSNEGVGVVEESTAPAIDPQEVKENK